MKFMMSRFVSLVLVAIASLTAAKPCSGQDTNPPTVVSAVFSASLQEVVLTFSEPMEPMSTTDVFNYAVVSSSLFRVVVQLTQEDVAGTTFRLFLDGPADPASVLSIGFVTDLAGNILVPVPTEVPIQPPGEDLTPPTVLAAEFGASLQEVLVTFSESMDPFVTTDPFNFEVSSSSGLRSVVQVTQADPSGTVFRLLLDAPADPVSTLTVVFVMDLAGNFLVPQPTVVPIQASNADTTPPSVSCAVTVGLLFPPNGALRDVGLSVTASDNVTANPTVTVSVQSDESIGAGDVVYSGGVLLLRAARDDAGDGRVYLVKVTAADEAGNQATTCTTVVVPHDNSPESVSAANAQAAAAAVNCTLPPPNCTPSGIVAWWPLDGDGLDIISGNTLTLFGSPSFVAGEVSQALVFDGADDSATAAASASLNVGVGAGLTIEGWIRPFDLSHLRPLVEWNDGLGNIGAHFWVSVDILAPNDGSRNLYGNLVDTAGVSHQVATATGLLSTNAWQHVALTYDKASGQAVIYHNGVLAGQASLGTFTPQTSYPFHFGLRPSGPFGGIRFAGGMDEFSLYNRALSLSEVAGVFSAGPSGKCSLSSP